MKEVKFLIIGQGLAGTLLAFEMLKRGMQFHILSSEERSSASMVAAGMINPLVFKRLTKSWHADELLPVMKQKYIELELLLDSTFLFEKPILKPLSEQEKQLWVQKRELDDFKNYIGPVSENAVYKGVRSAPAFAEVNGSGYLDLALFLKKAELHFRQLGVISSGVFDIPALQSQKMLFDVAGIRAENVVFCNGFHLSKNPLFSFVKMNPAKGEVLLIKSTGLSEEYILNKQVFVLPVGSQRFKVGSTYEWDDLTEASTQKGKDSIVARLENLIDAEYEIEEHWAGIRPTIADRRPVLGRHPYYSNIFVFNGLGTKGVMLAPQMAIEFCDFLSDRNYILSSEINVRRFQ